MSTSEAVTQGRKGVEGDDLRSCTVVDAIKDFKSCFIVTTRYSKKFSPAAQWAAQRTLTARPAQVLGALLAPPAPTSPGTLSKRKTGDTRHRRNYSAFITLEIVL